MPKLRCDPLGLTLDLAEGAKLTDALFAHGVEFPCGGRGRCRGCRITVTTGDIAISEADQKVFTPEELAAGSRLACRVRVQGDAEIRLERYESPILCDDSTFAFTPRSGLAVAVDIGTTTLACQLVDLASGAVRSVRSGLNPQARHGADLVSRLEYALHGGADELRDMLRAEIGRLVGDVAQGQVLRRVVLVGNTVMHHLFCGIPCDCLALHPFEPVDPGERAFLPEDLGWALAADEVVFLPNLGGLVGSDLLAGILATDLHRRDGVRLVLDLGTNGEILAGGKDGIWCASTAAGPAFEGARIAQGMRASSGAIASVVREGDGLHCTVIGGGKARGVCGSGLVAAVASALELGWIGENGRFAAGRIAIPLRDGVALVQRDIRELQLAKGAVAAGGDLLAKRCGRSIDRVDEILLAGAFGNYIGRVPARRIGLLGEGCQNITAAGNTALLGAKVACFADDLSFADVRRHVRHLALNHDPGFEDAFIDGMSFPAQVSADLACS